MVTKGVPAKIESCQQEAVSTYKDGDAFVRFEARYSLLAIWEEENRTRSSQANQGILEMRERGSLEDQLLY